MERTEVHACEDSSSARWRGVLAALLLALTAASHATVEQDSDLLGHNLASFPLRSPDYRLCQQACEKDRRCKAATYVKPGVQGPQAMCYLKHTLVPRQPNNCCITWIPGGTDGVIAGAVQTRPETHPVKSAVITGVADLQAITPSFTRREGWDLVAPNLQRITLGAPNPDLCRDACAGRDGCEGYTYVKPGLQGPEAVCYLKGRIQRATENACCVSGAKVPPPFENLAPNSRQAIENQRLAAEYKANLQEFIREAATRLPPEIATANSRIQRQQALSLDASSQILRDQFNQFVETPPAPTKTVDTKTLTPLVVSMANTPQAGQLAGSAQINQSALTLAGPKPEVTGILTAPVSPVATYVREGGYVLLFGRNFGSQPGKVMLTFRKEPIELSAAPPQETAVTLEPWQGSWSAAWRDDLVVARVPMLPPGFTLLGARLTLWRDGTPPMRLDVPVQLIRRNVGVHTVKASPEYGDHVNRDAAVFGGELLLTGESFGAQRGKIYLELTTPVQGKRRIDLLPGRDNWAKSWHDRFIYARIPDLKANVPTQTAMLVIEPSYGVQGGYRRPISFGPRMIYALVPGEEFLELDRDAPDNWTDLNNPYLRVSHGPDCTWYRWFGSDGTDHFFRNKQLPGNSRVVRALIVPVDHKLPWTTWDIVISEVGDLVGAFFGSPLDMAAYFAKGLGMVVGQLFDSNIGTYRADVKKMPDRNDPTGSVRWFTTCLSFHPAQDLPIVYISSFLIEGPEGFVPGEIVETIP
jgi:hypothetical protein